MYRRICIFLNCTNDSLYKQDTLNLIFGLPWNIAMNKNFKVSILFLFGISCTPALKNRLSRDILEEERLKLRNFAFCQCVLQLHKENTLLINDGSSAGYFEKGAYSMEAYETIDCLSALFSNYVYLSKEGHTLELMKCLDFYNSKELEWIIKSFDKDLY